MTKEEKKAMEHIKGFIGLFYEYPKPTGVLVQDYEVKNFETILNLIQSKQKEIEKLKDKSKIEHMIKTSLYNQIDLLQKEIEKKDEEIHNLKRVLELGLNKEKQYCFNRDGNTEKCLGYGDDEPCDYCKSCKRLNID